MPTVIRNRLLVVFLVGFGAFLIAFRPVRLGPFEEFRIEVTMRYRFPEPLAKVAGDRPIEDLVKEVLEEAKVRLADPRVVGQHLLIIVTEAPTHGEALKLEQRIHKAIKKQFPKARLIETTREPKGEKPLWRLGRWGLFKPTLNIHFGLDLRGGTRIVLQLHRCEFWFELEKSVGETKERRLAARETITVALQKEGLENFDVQVDETGRLIIVRTQSSTPKEVAYHARLIQRSLRKLYGKTKELAKRRQVFEVNRSAINVVKEIIRRRIDKYGVAEPQIYTEGSDRIVVELPGVRDPEEAFRLIGEMGQLEFRSVPEKYRVEEETIGDETRVVFLDKEGNRVPHYQVYADPQSILIASGRDLDPPAIADFDEFGRPQVRLTFKGEGKRRFADFTMKNVGKPLAIWYDRECISAPIVQQPILDGKARITGLDSMEEANLLRIILDAGALPVPVSVLWRQSISPTLGTDTIHKSKNVALVAIVLIALFSVCYYRLPGLIACLTLALYALLVLAVMSTQIGDWRPILTLPGIIGFIISLGMALDANIIIFERLKEELRAGKTLRTAVELAFDRAWTAILDAQVTTLIAAAILSYFGTGPIKGFATVLMIGTLVNLFTAVFATRSLLEWVGHTGIGEFGDWFRPLAFFDRLLRLPGAPTTPRP